MTVSKRVLLAIAATAAIGTVAGTAVAQWQNSPLMRGYTDNWSPGANAAGELASNEGIYVDVKNFNITKGKAKGDANAQIAKLGAREVADGAIIFRHGDKLYIVDSMPPR